MEVQHTHTHTHPAVHLPFFISLSATATAQKKSSSLCTGLFSDYLNVLKAQSSIWIFTDELSAGGCIFFFLPVKQLLLMLTQEMFVAAGKYYSVLFFCADALENPNQRA